MPDDVRAGAEPSMTSLVTGIINDARDLFQQQVALFRHEVQEDFRKTKEAALALVVGGGVATLGVVFLCAAVVWFLNWVTNDRLPLWVCFLIVGGVITTAGVVLLFLGKKKMESFNPLPDQSAQALRENVQWITNPK